jgi:hypothetical protein
MKLVALIVFALLLAGCWSAPPTQQTSTTTTVSCPAGTALGSDGMCH